MYWGKKNIQLCTFWLRILDLKKKKKIVNDKRISTFLKYWTAKLSFRSLFMHMWLRGPVANHSSSGVIVIFTQMDNVGIKDCFWVQCNKMCIHYNHVWFHLILMSHKMLLKMIERQQ